MQPGHTHQILEAIDRALGVFAQTGGRLSTDDYQLKRDLELIRLKVSKAESRGPYLSSAPPAVDPVEAAADPLLTKAPWTKL